MSELDFDALISPITLDQFFSEYWEAKPLRLSRKQSEYYAPLISGADVDYLLSTACLLDREGVELLGGPEPHDGSAKNPVGELYQAYRQGASFRVRGVNRYWKPLWTLCLRIQDFFGFQVGVNLYCSPPNSRGLERHYDLHDAIILQISGSKNWRVFGSPMQLPLEHVPLMKFERSGNGLQYRSAPVIKDVVAAYDDNDLIDEFKLDVGDLLYLPRGFVHQAWSTDELSAHVTIGIYPITWVDLIAVALGQVGHRDVRFRRALPVGFNNRSEDMSIKEGFGTLLQEIAKQADVARAVDEINASFIWNHQTIGEGSITNINSQPIELQTIVERRPGLLCRFVIDGAFVRLAACHGDLSLPRHFESAIRYLSDHQSFRVGEIPGKLSEQSKITLVRRLIDDGFLRAAGGANW